MSLTPIARAALLLVVTGALPAVLAACEPPRPDPPKQCDPTGAIPNGCLSDEICVDFKCVPRPKCETSDDCESSAFQCVLPAQICELRPGFGQECKAPDAPCGLGEFCALGVCRVVEETRECARRTDCPVGQKCDRNNLLCIPDADCRLAGDFPELGCDPGETCDAFTGQCLLPCQNECTPETVEEDCGPQQQCDAACRCVQCLADDDCGAGLVCNIRAGRCQSEDLCFTDEDCDPPLICGETQLCQVAPPACEDDFDCQVAEVCDIGTGRCVLPDGPCEQDRFEPGADTPADAELVDVAAGGIELLDDLTLCPNDDDVFAVVLDAGDVLTAVVTNTDPRARATMFLLDASGETSLRFAETAPRGNGTIVYVAQEEETVFLRVTALVAATPYDLTLDRAVGGATCQVDFFDNGAPNDSTLTASPLAVPPNGVTVAGSICPGDVDYFNVSVAAGEALAATLTFDGAATDLDIALVDATDGIIALDAGDASPARVRQRFVTSEEVFVRVRGFGNEIGAYTLAVVREPPFVCAPDAVEPADDDVATAPVLALGEERGPEERTVCSQDEDLLVVPLEDFERLIVSATYDDTEVELAIDVLDQAGVTVLETSPPATGGAAVTYDANGDETVVVRVRGKGGAVGPYTLRVEKENQLDCAADLGEPNNTVQTAVGLRPVGELLSICEADQDFFAIEGTAGKKLVVDASFRQADGDIDLMLLGLDGTQILAVADGTSDGEHLEVLLPLDGRYTLRVFSLTSGAKARYTLAVSQVTP